MKLSLWGHSQAFLNSKNLLEILLYSAKRLLEVENQHKISHRTLDFLRAQDLFCRQSQQTNFDRTKAPKISSKYSNSNFFNFLRFIDRTPPFLPNEIPKPLRDQDNFNNFHDENNKRIET
jgi:hypothetical protein